MYWTSGIVVYVIAWWLVFFMMLPVGVKTPDKPETGHAASAPVKPMLVRKALITSVIAAVIWAVVYWIVESNFYSFRQ
ncbi:DUF1467 family protein [Oceanibaculum nanhaiense]|uniref:DUF1467 family protein n=1 Tax=Oceanibaculum nanhaiense TaxID=1909734 RepID=UPI00396E1884